MRTSIKALIASLVLGTSALASAAPCEPAPAPAPVHAVYQQPAQPIYVQPVYHPAPAPAPTRSWMNLTGGLTLSGKTAVAVGQQKGKFTTLELAAGWGNGYTRVKSVTVYFANGSSQVIAVNQKLDHANNNIQLDLSGQARFITRIAINGQSYGRSAVEIRGLKIA